MDFWIVEGMVEVGVRSEGYGWKLGFVYLVLIGVK